MLFDNDFDLNMFFQKENSNKKQELVNDEIGLIRGNMFPNEYKPYKNITPNKISTNNEQDALLLKIYEIDFAIKDLNLYLDLHKEDQYMYEIFQNYCINLEKYKKTYEKMYGPLCIDSYLSDTYEWTNNPWPWNQDGGNKYV